MVFGLFSKEKALKRAMDKTVSKHAQSADRWAAMEKLRTDGSEESLFGLCRRFSFNYDKTIEDEQEKQWVYETLTAKGKDSIEPLRRYMKSADSIAYPLRVLENVTDTDEALAVIDDLLSDEEPGYTRMPQKRIQIIEWLGEWTKGDHQQVLERVLPYMADFDENVRFATVEAANEHPAEQAEQALVEALLREDEESKRVKIRIAEVLAEHGMSLHGRKNDVAELFDNDLEGFKLQNNKLIRK